MVLNDSLPLGPRSDPFEMEADRAADRAASGSRVGPLAPATGAPTAQPKREADGDGEREVADDSRRGICAGASGGNGSDDGKPLPGPLRGVMEGSFQSDFAAVRVHDDQRAAALNRRFGAKALTAGNHIYFGAGRFDPASGPGRRLIAHELAHTVQQQAIGVRIQRDPEDETVQQVLLFKDTNRVLIITDQGRYEYQLTRKEIEPGRYVVEHVQGRSLDTRIIEYPEGVTGSIDWRFKPLRPDQPSWADFQRSRYELRVFGKSTGESLAGEAAGEGKQGGGGGESDAGQRKEDGEPGEGDGGERSDQEKEERLKRFLSQFGEGEKGGSVDRAKLKELVNELSDQELEDFRSLFDQISEEKPDQSLDKLLKYYAGLSPSEREILRTNKTIAESMGAETTTELPEEVELALKSKSEETANVSQKAEDVNRSLNAIRSSIRDIDPDKAEHFEPLDPSKLTAFNQLLMLEGMLAGAAQRSPEIEDMAKELTSNIGKIREFILRELAWLSAELAATTLLSILAAPASGGTSAVAGSAAAAALIVRINRLRKILDAVMRIRAVVDTVQQVKRIFETVQKASEYKAQLEEYRTKMEKLQKLQQQIKEQGAGLETHKERDKLEDELLELMQDLIDRKEGGLGEVLEFLYLPEDMTQDELKGVLLDLPRGIEAAEEMLEYYQGMKEGDLESTKVLTFKAFRAGYLMFPLVGYITGLANEQLNALLEPKTIGERLMGILERAAVGRRGRRGRDRAESNRQRFKSIKSNRQRRRERRRAERDRDRASERDRDRRKRRKKKQEQEEEEREERETGTSGPEVPGRRRRRTDDDDERDRRRRRDEEEDDEQRRKRKKKDEEEEDEDDDQAAQNRRAWRRLERDLRDLPDEFDDGGRQSEILREARQIADKRRYRRVAGGVSASHSSAKPSHWTIRVSRRDRPGDSASVDVLKTERTRYEGIRAAIRKAFRDLPDERRDGDYLRRELRELEREYDYLRVKVEAIEGDNGEVMEWQILSWLPQRSKSEVIAVEAPGNHFGSENNPIPMDWPKRAYDAYEPVYVGPYVGDNVAIAQTELRALKPRPKDDREDFADALKSRSGADTANIDKWIADDCRVRTYTSDDPKDLPYSSRSTIGVTRKYRVERGYKFRLDPQGGTPGGGMINRPLRKFGYRPNDEGTDGDHVLEYQLGGPNDRENMWPLDSAENSSAGSVVKSMRFATPGGRDVLTMDELKRRARRRGRRNEVWFRIASTKVV